MPDLTKGAQHTVDSTKPLYDAVVKATYDNTKGDQLAATRAGVSALTDHIKAPAIATNIVGTFLSSVASVLAVAVRTFTEIKADSQNGIHDLTASLLGDALLLDIKGADIPASTQDAGQASVNAALGAKFVDAIKSFVGADGAVTGDSAEKGAAALVGLAMQMSVNTAFYAAAGGCIPEVHLDELKELGEQLEKSLGLGRLIRRALTPLIQQTVALPLQHKYAAQYRQNILGTGELAKAVLADRMPGDSARTLLTQHGLTDDQITELLEQHTPRLKPEEFEHIAALERGSVDSSFSADVADGAPGVVRQSRTKLLTWKRLSGERNRVLTAVLSNIKQGFAPVSDLDGWLSRFGIPEDEATLWRLAAGYEAESVRKRISEGDMLFLYEAAQVTDEDVREFLKDEGYSLVDIERKLTFFRLKSIEASHKTTGGAAARAAHIHAEHVAFVTDTITGLWERNPTKAELDYWVTLLDTNERTKGDFKTELKALDTSGPAIPQAV
jgi:hypothetical protein